MPATPLHRHQLARLSSAGWQRVLAREWDAQARECLAHWAANGLPLVITRQPPASSADAGIAMGLPAPARWGRRRFTLQVPRADVSYFDEFPRLGQVVGRWPEGRRRTWQGLSEALAACGVVARVHGSHGWQFVTGLDHVHGHSDIDLWIAVCDDLQADRVAALLQAFPGERPRLDGELVADGNAVAWREWLAWRAGRAKAVLVKRLDGCDLRQHPSARHLVVPEEATV
jgi:phosphoribosyl-dephospho-CoA transferase